jgi:ribosomal protein L9
VQVYASTSNSKAQLEQQVQAEKAQLEQQVSELQAQRQAEKAQLEEQVARLQAQAGEAQLQVAGLWAAYAALQQQELAPEHGAHACPPAEGHSPKSGKSSKM